MVPHSSTLALKIPWMEELGAGYYPWGHKGPTSLLPSLSDSPKKQLRIPPTMS